MIKEKFRLNPFGNCIIKQILNQGKMFNIYLAELCGQEVCLKTPVLHLRALRIVALMNDLGLL